jgi:hypothetical protein
MCRKIVGGFALLGGLVAALDLGYHLGGGGSMPGAEGQEAAPEFILAAANTQNETLCYAFNTRTQQLVTYMQRPTATTGIELKAIRICKVDFNPAIEEYPSTENATAPGKMEALAEQLQKLKEKEKKKK